MAHKRDSITWIGRTSYLYHSTCSNCLLSLPMNIEEFRDYCLSLPDVTEATPFEKMSRERFTILVFYIHGHIFCYFKVEDFSNITIKCCPSDISELMDQYQAIDKPYNGDKRYWISIQPNLDLPDDYLIKLVRKSYEIVKSKYK